MSGYLYRLVDPDGNGAYRGDHYERLVTLLGDGMLSDDGGVFGGLRPMPWDDPLVNPGPDEQERARRIFRNSDLRVPTLDDIPGEWKGDGKPGVFGFASLGQARSWWGRRIAALDGSGFKLRVFKRADAPVAFEAKHQALFAPPPRHVDLEPSAMLRTEKEIAALVHPVLG